MELRFTSVALRQLFQARISRILSICRLSPLSQHQFLRRQNVAKSLLGQEELLEEKLFPLVGIFPRIFSMKYMTEEERHFKLIASQNYSQFLVLKLFTIFGSQKFYNNIIGLQNFSQRLAPRTHILFILIGLIISSPLDKINKHAEDILILKCFNNTTKKKW